MLFLYTHDNKRFKSLNLESCTVFQHRILNNLPYVQKQQQKTLKANAKRFQNKKKNPVKAKLFFLLTRLKMKKKKKS